MKIFILAYNSGMYEDRTKTNFAVIVSEYKANELTRSFNLIKDWFVDKSVLYYKANSQFLASQPLPTAPHGLGKKSSNPIWKAMSQKEWEVILLDYKNNILTPLEKAYDEAITNNFAARNEWSNKWWEEMMKSFPAELKDYLEKYPASRLAEDVFFFYQELPVWD